METAQEISFNTTGCFAATNGATSNTNHTKNSSCPVNNGAEVSENKTGEPFDAQHRQSLGNREASNNSGYIFGILSASCLLSALLVAFVQKLTTSQLIPLHFGNSFSDTVKALYQLMIPLLLSHITKIFI